MRTTERYRGQDGVVDWCGCTVDDPSEFTAFIAETVRARLEDSAKDLTQQVQVLSDTPWSSEFLEEFLAEPRNLEPWEIGETIAECLLERREDVDICWPWNMRRDRRTPNASLPGADLVGFLTHGAETYLLFGEVKTSAERRSPPNVTTGRDGLRSQLERLGSDRGLQATLLKWLNSRCRAENHRHLFRNAVATFLRSDGPTLALVGVLLRDTEPLITDLESMGRTLSSRVAVPLKVELSGWYLPVPISDWPHCLTLGASP